MAHSLDNGALAAGGYRRIFKNIGWLLGGKGFGAVCSLVYLAILARSLGVKDFGHFSLIFGTAQALVALAGFQTWQMIVRFGAPDVLAERWQRFERLAVLGAVIDAVGAFLGCLIAAAMIYGLGDALELNPTYIDPGFWFICALVWARASAPLGVLRVLDRYDVAVRAGAITPAARLVAAVAIWLTGPSVERFLFAWAAIEIFVAVLYWVLAHRLVPGGLRLEKALQWRGTVDEHPGIVGFLGLTYVNASLVAVLQQGPLLAIGYLLGTSAAGVYRIADQLAKGLSKLSSLTTQALYPEMQRQRHGTPVAEFRRLVRSITIGVLLAGIVVVVLAMVLGEPLLVLIGGADFARGGVVLLPLAIGAAFELASVTYDPVLHSTGHTYYPVVARAFAIVVMGVGIIVLAPMGPIGIGWAVAGAMACSYLALSLATHWVLRREQAA